jgi:hypothetical protein
MVTRSDVFKSRYLKAADLSNGPVVATIRVAALETLKGYSGSPENKVVIYFTRGVSPLILNRINWDSVADIAGDESDNWGGAQIELYAATAEVQGVEKPCVRIRAPGEQPVLKAKAADAQADSLSDEIPF